ncbi:MAG: HAD family phosphatase [Planctomycetota bacterium]|nr:HAD family phosphatase [Planctomycetota bacterium]
MVFDFDGVVCDSEPIHFEAFHATLARAGVDLGREDYYEKYLGYDDRGAFLAIARDHGLVWPAEQVARLSADKTVLVQEMLARSARAMPGVLELIAAASDAGVPLAICSGALRAEIELPCRCLGILERFRVIVSAEDVSQGKPNPEGYRLACSLLARALGRPLNPARCLVVEDSPFGIQAAKAAGMKVLAAATSYPLAALAEADLSVEAFTDVALPGLRALTDSVA